MQTSEYRVEPAPRRGTKAKGLKTTEDRFAAALTAKLNKLTINVNRPQLSPAEIAKLQAAMKAKD